MVFCCRWHFCHLCCPFLNQFIWINLRTFVSWSKSAFRDTSLFKDSRPISERYGESTVGECFNCDPYVWIKHHVHVHVCLLHPWSEMSCRFNKSKVVQRCLYSLSTMIFVITVVKICCGLALNKFWPLWWWISLSIRVETMLNHFWFVFYHNIQR